MIHKELLKVLSDYLRIYAKVLLCCMQYTQHSVDVEILKNETKSVEVGCYQQSAGTQHLIHVAAKRKI